MGHACDGQQRKRGSLGYTESQAVNGPTNEPVEMAATSWVSHKQNQNKGGINANVKKNKMITTQGTLAEYLVSDMGMEL